MAVTVSKMAVSNSISSLGGDGNAHTINIVNSNIARRLIGNSSTDSRALFDASLLLTKNVPLMLSVTRARYQQFHPCHYHIIVIIITVF